MSEFFSPSWQVARDRFHAATGTFLRGSIDVVDGYTVDWAMTGDPDASRVLVYSSGLHGVEGFPGSAAQLALLARDWPVTILWMHVLNPWGMAHLRRVNEHNVDLNRNFLAPGQAYTSDDPTYAQVDELLNPRTAEAGFELFWPKVGWVVARHGYQTLKNAVVGGQHQNPHGLFFGGATLEAGPGAILRLADELLAGRERVVHVDWHSGLGAYGGRTLLLEGQNSPEKLARVRRVMGPDVKGWDASNTDAYEIRGGMLMELGRRLPGCRFDGLTCEFGTYPNLKVLAALRNENRLQHWGSPVLDHPAKLALRQTFAPMDPRWEASVLRHAAEVHEQAMRLLQSE
jgi:hypothetical protein